MPPATAHQSLRVLSVIAPMTQLNTPYPSTAYLTGFLRSRGIDAVQEDLALALALALLSRDGLQALRDEIGVKAPASASVAAFVAQYGSYRASIAPAIAFLQGGDATLAHRIAGRAFLPEGGDMVPAERNVTVAVGHGKKAARHIDAWLRGQRLVPTPKHAVATFDKLNPWYYSDAPKTLRPLLDLARRTSSFDEVQGGLSADNALFEARRCLSCGNCFECDNCYGVCPDNAVIKLGPGKRFEFNYDYCKGCGMCVAECPCGAIEMVPEDV